jgi:hypothetical protein
MEERDSPQLSIVNNGCPICKGQVIGSYEYNYYCRNCNLLFREGMILKNIYKPGS